MDQSEDGMWEMVIATFLVMVVMILIFAAFSVGQIEAIDAARQCVSYQEWCKIERPEIYGALYGDGK